MGGVGQGKEISRRQKSRPAKRGCGGRGVWGEFRRTRANTKRGQPRRPARSEQNPAKKLSFPFRRKNPARAKSEMQRKLFYWVASGSERRRAGFLSFVQRKFEQSV